MSTKSNVVPIGTALNPFEPGLQRNQVAARIRANGGRCTDGPIDLATFTAGWAKSGSPASTSRVAHYLTLKRGIGPIDGHETFGFQTLCGTVVFAAERIAPLLRPGNWPNCGRCERARGAA